MPWKPIAVAAVVAVVVVYGYNYAKKNPTTWIGKLFA